MNILNQTGQSTKTLAQTIAKQIANEPLEVLKNAADQTLGLESVKPSNENKAPNIENDNSAIQTELDKMKTARRLEALEREMLDIKRQKLFVELQKRIANGEEIAIEDYFDLSMEQKQVLKAQMEAVKAQNTRQKILDDSPLVEPIAKRGRRFFNFGKKQEVKKQQTHVEKIVSPSS